MTMRGLPLIIILWYVVLIMGAQSGPFKASYTRVEECSNPALPIDKNPAASFFAKLYNTTTETNLMRGEITVLREHRIKKMKAKSYIRDKNKWKVNYVMDNFGCNRIVFPLAAMSVGLKYDPKTCTMYKGVYIFSDFKVNKFQHMWMKTQEYGRVLWRFEVFSHAGTVFCYELETLIEPADD